MTTTPATRIGGHLVAESLAALGAEVAFGVPGIHALAIWEALRDGPHRRLRRPHRALRRVRRRRLRAQLAAVPRRCCSRPARVR